MPQRMYETCTIQGCTRKHKAAGYCATHYAQHRRGFPLTAIKPRDRNHGPTCSEDGCASPVKSKDLCQMHYARLLRHGFTKNRDRKKPFLRCSEPECGNHMYANGLCNRHYLRARDAAKFGLTLAGLGRILESQKGRCAICHQEPRSINGKSGKVTDFNLDHDHKTSEARGLLCSHCNRAIGLLDDDPMILTSALLYLAHHSPDASGLLCNAISSLTGALSAAVPRETLVA